MLLTSCRNLLMFAPPFPMIPPAVWNSFWSIADIFKTMLSSAANLFNNQQIVSKGNWSRSRLTRLWTRMRRLTRGPLPRRRLLSPPSLLPSASSSRFNPWPLLASNYMPVNTNWNLRKISFCIHVKIEQDHLHGACSASLDKTIYKHLRLQML